MSGPQAFVIQNDTTIVWDNYLYPGGTSLARYYPGWELHVSPWDKVFVWNNAGPATPALTVERFAPNWSLRASQYDSVYVWGVYGTHLGTTPVLHVNPLARWVIPNPVLHNKEQAIVQKAIDVKIDAIKKVQAKLPAVSLAERKALLKRLAELEQALDRLIDLFEFNAQQVIRKKIQEEEEELIVFILGEL